ncbi:MAG: PAS domain S-box protein [Chitinophagaceae bacterium]
MPGEELRMFTLFEMTPDLVCIVSKEGYFQKINPAVSKSLEYTESELMAVPVATFIHEGDRERTAAQRAKLLSSQPLLNFQNRYCTKSGNTLWLEWTSIYLPEKEIVFAIAKDITVHKQKEQELQENYTRFRQLAVHFKNGIEKDRKQFASDLHEDLGQLATTVKTEIDCLSGADCLPVQLHKHMDSLTKTTELLLHKIRKMSYAISPGAIADLGLDAALEMLSEEFSAITGIGCHYQSSFSEEALTYEVGLDVYRVCQEALLNIMQHAEASLVSIVIEHDQAGGLHLTVTDNGKGLDPAASVLTGGHTSMHGRAMSINGHLSIKNTDKGTVVKLVIIPEPGLVQEHRMHE